MSNSNRIATQEIDQEESQQSAAFVDRISDLHLVPPISLLPEAYKKKMAGLPKESMEEEQYAKLQRLDAQLPTKSKLGAQALNLSVRMPKPHEGPVRLTKAKLRAKALNLSIRIPHLWCEKRQMKAYGVFYAANRDSLISDIDDYDHQFNQEIPRKPTPAPPLGRPRVFKRDSYWLNRQQSFSRDGDIVADETDSQEGKYTARPKDTNITAEQPRKLTRPTSRVYSPPPSTRIWLRGFEDPSEARPITEAVGESSSREESKSNPPNEGANTPQHGESPMLSLWQKWRMRLQNTSLESRLTYRKNNSGKNKPDVPDQLAPIPEHPAQHECPVVKATNACDHPNCHAPEDSPGYEERLEAVIEWVHKQDYLKHMERMLTAQGYKPDAVPVEGQEFEPKQEHDESVVAKADNKETENETENDEAGRKRKIRAGKQRELKKSYPVKISAATERV
ncbi:MAG: hypothetical protein M1829_002785 [Trizodia sp. TS-e1964]|nr:MAG: hypothetical protein M1829_002785 [Trizodia sp. TS-e1964]